MKFSVHFNDGYIVNDTEDVIHIKSNTLFIGDTILISIPFSYGYTKEYIFEDSPRMMNKFNDYNKVVGSLLNHAKTHLVFKSKWMITAQVRSGDIINNKQVMFCSWFSNDDGDFSLGLRYAFQKAHKARIIPLYVEWRGHHNITSNGVQIDHDDNADYIRFMNFSVMVATSGVSKVAEVVSDGGLESLMSLGKDMIISSVIENMMPDVITIILPTETDLISKVITDTINDKMSM